MGSRGQVKKVPAGGLARRASLLRVVKEVVQLVREQVGAVASLRQAAVVAALPKTRSGKILRGVMRAIADGDEYSLPGTIDDASVVEGVTRALVQLGYAGGSTTTRC